MPTFTNKSKTSRTPQTANEQSGKTGAVSPLSPISDDRSVSASQQSMQTVMNSNPSVAQLKATQEAMQRKPAFASHSGLPDQLKSGIEQLSGIGMDDVKVHYNSSSPAQFQAYAYAKGTDIHLATGQEKHLPHEAWHVVQQKQGRVKPTLQMNGVGVNDNNKLEKEADVMGGKAAAQGKQLSKTQQAERTKRGGLSNDKMQSDTMLSTKAYQFSKGGRSSLSHKVDNSIAPIQRERDKKTLPPVKTAKSPQKPALSPVKPQGSIVRPSAPEVKNLVLNLNKIHFLGLIDLANAKDRHGRINYEPPGLSSTQREKIPFGSQASKEKQVVIQTIKDDKINTEEKINYLEEYIDSPEMRADLMRMNLSGEDRKKIKEELIEIKEAQEMWLNKIVSYGDGFGLGLQGVDRRVTADGALTIEAFRRAEGGGDSKSSHLGHLAPMANSILKLLLGVMG